MRYLLTLVVGFILGAFLASPPAKPDRPKPVRTKTVHTEVVAPVETPLLLYETPLPPNRAISDYMLPEMPDGPGLVIPDEHSTGRLTPPGQGGSAWDWPELVFPPEEEEPEAVPDERK